MMDLDAPVIIIIGFFELYEGVESMMERGCTWESPNLEYVT
jgi:hypothetical protein